MPSADGGAANTVGQGSQFDPTQQNSALQQLIQAIQGNTAGQAGQLQAGYNLSNDALQAQLALLQPYLSSQTGFINQDLANQLAGIGLSRTGLQQEQGYLGQQYGLQQQGFDQALQQAIFGAGQQTRGAQSSATARGAVNTSGYGQQLQDIQKQLGFTESTIGRERTGATDRYQYQLQQIQNQLQRLGLDESTAKTAAARALGQLGLGVAQQQQGLIGQVGQLQEGQAQSLLNLVPNLG